jgi:hypothetical protein
MVLEIANKAAILIVVIIFMYLGAAFIFQAVIDGGGSYNNTYWVNFYYNNSSVFINQTTCYVDYVYRVDRCNVINAYTLHEGDTWNVNPSSMCGDVVHSADIIGYASVNINHNTLVNAPIPINVSDNGTIILGPINTSSPYVNYFSHNILHGTPSPNFYLTNTTMNPAWLSINETFSYYYMNPNISFALNYSCNGTNFTYLPLPGQNATGWFGLKYRSSSYNGGDDGWGDAGFWFAWIVSILLMCWVVMYIYNEFMGGM